MILCLKLQAFLQRHRQWRQWARDVKELMQLDQCTCSLCLLPSTGSSLAHIRCWPCGARWCCPMLSCWGWQHHLSHSRQKGLMPEPTV